MNYFNGLVAGVCLHYSIVKCFHDNTDYKAQAIKLGLAEMQLSETDPNAKPIFVWLVAEE